MLLTDALTESFFQPVHIDHSRVSVENNRRTIDKRMLSRLNERGRIGVRSLRCQIDHDRVATFWIRRSEQSPEMFLSVARFREHHWVAECEHGEWVPKRVSA